VETFSRISLLRMAPLIDELLQSSQIAVDKFRDLVLLHGNQLLVE